MDVVFAFAGQVIFIELQSDMAQPEDFPKSVGASLGVMAVVYVLVASVGYVYIGASALADGRPLTSYLSGTLLRVVNGFLAVHVLIAYVIEGNVLVRNVLSMLGVATEDLTAETLRARLLWLACTSALVGGAFGISSVVPFFSDVMGFFAALCSIMLSYTFPLLFAIKLLPLPKWKAWLWGVLAVIAAGVAVAGTVATSINIFNKVRSESAVPPFACDAQGTNLSVDATIFL